MHFDPPVHTQPFYTDMGWKKGDFPITEQISETIVTLPMFPQLTKEQLKYMVDKVIETIDSL